MKRITALALVAVMMFTLIPVYSVAAVTESEINTLLGELSDSPVLSIVINADSYNDGETLIVTVTVADIPEGGVCGVQVGKFTYDTTKLTLNNAVLDSGALDCVTTTPGSEWEGDNFSKINNDGTLTLASMGGLVDTTQLLTKAGDLVFTLNFTVAEGTTEDLLFYAPHSSVKVTPAGEIRPSLGKGTYAISSHVCAAGHTPDYDNHCEQDQTCTVCGDLIAAMTGHDYDSVVTDPTCTEGGYTTHTCSYCGDSYQDNKLSALGHKPGTAADCENDQTCTVCGAVVTPALGHDYDSVVTAPTCTAQGYTTYTCGNCGDSYVADYVSATGHNPGAEADCENAQTCLTCGTTLAPSLGHDYKTVVTAPTCTAQGYTTHTCDNCGDSYVDSYVDAWGHSYTRVVTAPTCTEKGYTTFTCEDCGDSYVGEYVRANGHTAGEAANCTQDQICTVCGETLVPALGHKPSEGATCTEDQTCTVCGEVITGQFGHNYEVTATVEATCTVDGYTTYTCSLCGDSYDGDFVKASHDPGTAADCENDQTCTTCGEVLTPALGHNPGTAADCENDQTCTTCGEVLEEAYGHNPGTAADCENDQTCTTCGEVLASALGHKPGTAADCTNDQTCTVCGDVVAPALGHTPGDEATCTSDQTCTVCGEVLATAGGHGDGEWVTLDNKDKELRCEHCGELLDIDVFGDVNRDDKVDIFDYLIVKSIYFKTYTPSEDEAARADVNNDGNIDVFDYLEVKTLCF